MLPLCSVAFLVFGVVLVLVGANQAELARDLQLDLAHTGLLGSGLAGGLGIGLVAAGPLFDRLPRRPLFVGATALAALALGTVERDMGFPRWMAHVVATGVGVGLYDTMVSAVIVQRFRERAARPMNLVHSAATAGAVLGPLAVAWFADHRHWSESFVAVGLAHLGLAGWAALTPFPAPDPRADATPHGRVSATALLPFAAMAFAYVGVESSLTVFAIPYAADGLSLDPARGRLAISALWLGLCVGRIGTAALPRHDARLLGLAGVAGFAVLATAVAFAFPAVELVFFAGGLALASVYPLTMTLAGQRFPRAQGVATGLAGGAGALGGFSVPWISGALGDAAGIAVAMGSLALWSGAIAVAAARVR